jgi:hypothetical protein
MKKTLAMATMAAPAALAGAQSNGFEAATIAHTGTLRVDAAPEHAYQLFNAPGERLWVDGWNPIVLSGGDGRPKGSVWVTGEGSDQTIWLVVDYDPEKLHARYARVTAGSRAGTVEIFARPDGSGATEVEVTYELTALNEDGNKALADFGAEDFALMLVEWEQMIRDANIRYPVQIDD